ncbi:MAG: molecular chaperone TorD family protein [Halorhabdus sp.]
MSDASPATGEDPSPAESLDPGDVATDPAARGVVYRTLSVCFDNPSEDLHARLLDGRLADGLREAIQASALTVSVPDLDPEGNRRTLSGRYNRLFALGQTVVTDRTDGSVESEGPAVSLYASSHREDATWAEINADLARAYEYYGLGVDETEREHHDNLRLQLEFAGYLARREALGEADAARARRDFLDRHLKPFADSLREALREADDGVYAAFGEFLAAFVNADRADLADRLDAGEDTADSAEVAW